MTTTTCDMCCEPVGKNTVYIRLPSFDTFDLCEVCARPILVYMANRSLLTDNSLKYIYADELGEASYQNGKE